MHPATAHVPAPDLTLTDGTPASAAYGDVYFSRHGGVAETTHVYLSGNGLPARFVEKPHFTIGELGFGTGLNFLVAWQAFLAHAPAGHHLHYIAIEKFPLTVAMLRDVLALHPPLAPLVEQLIAAMPLRLPGLHRIHLPRVSLTLCYGDVEELMPQLDLAVDAWFLDGFSPAKNPAMWSDEVLGHLGRLSAPDATLATFTAASAVRAKLAAQGFAIERVKGFGFKRQMVVGKRDGAALPVPAIQTAIIVGGGIAGCTLARSLAERGLKVTLLERVVLAHGASGNAGGVLFPQLTKRWTQSAAWYFNAYSFTLQQLARWKADGLDFTREECGMLRLPRHAEEEAQLRGLNEALGLDTDIVYWAEQAEASAHAGVTLATGAAWFPRGTWLSPAPLCRALVQHPNITVQEHAAVVSCEETSGAWTITTANGARFTAQHCCITTAHDAAALLPHFTLRLNAVGGQVSLITPAESLPLRSILCHKGYVIPLGKQFLTGATYNHGDDSLDVTPENHAKNVAEVETFLPALATGTVTGGRTALRATTPDRLPYVGKLAEGLWISAGHGSRGMLSAPLAAEVIASELCGEQVPLTQALRSAVNPRRFTKA